MEQVSHLSPAWVSQPPDAVQECWEAVQRRVTGSERDAGVSWTLRWLFAGEVGPVTSRPPTQSTRESARAESWAALCLAADMPEPTEADWRRLGAEPLPLVKTLDREFAYGTWRTLSWLLGVRGDWPVHSGWHVSASLPVECPHNYVPQRERDTDAWRAADQAARERAQAEALAHWRHIRKLADETAQG